MKRLVLTLAGLTLLACAQAMYGQKDVVYSNFMAGNGYLTDMTYSSSFHKDFTLAVPFTVPQGDFNYCLGQVTGQVDFIASQPNGPSKLVKVVITEQLTPTGTPVFTAYAPPVPPTPGLISVFPTGPGVLQAGLTYYLEFSASDNYPVLLWANNAGLGVSQVQVIDNTPGGLGSGPEPAILPAFRILATPCPPPVIKPAYNSFATLGPSLTSTHAEVALEVFCPPVPPSQTPMALFTCPIFIEVSPKETSAAICRQLADAVNAHTCPIWGATNANEPGAFHADCDGNNLRVTNSEKTLCGGAAGQFVCADVVHVVSNFAGKTTPFSASEFNGASGPLNVEFGGLVSGVAFDPALPDVIRVVHRGLISGSIFTANVPLPSGTSVSQIGPLLASALQAEDDDEVLATETGIVFRPQEPYDLTISVNDSSVNWAASPLPDLLERSVNHPPGQVPSCASSPTQLCLHHSRFAVQAAWRTQQGTTGLGIALPATDDAGSFYFFSASNLEVTVKVVDACAFIHKFWLFASGLTNVGVDLTVTDTLTGQVQTYHNPAGTPFQPIEDTGAFGSCS